ncbi:MAG: class I SAM-dependent methyltransferase [Promethearchaeia archaeon]
MSVENWKANDAEKILREIGIKEGQKVLDFGCGSGIYTLIVSGIVGRQGHVYALDEKKSKINKLKRIIKQNNIENIKLIHTSGEIDIPLKKNSLDVFFIYDVYHLLSEKNRSSIIKQAFYLLKQGGFLSYHATHLSGYGVDLQDVHRQMEQAGLRKKKRFEKQMFHWQWIEESTVYNYYKE